MLQSLRVLLRKEFLQISRDAVIMRMLFVMPMIQLLVLANAATFEVKRSRLWIADQDHSVSSRGLIDAFLVSGRFVVVPETGGLARADLALQAADVDMILVVPSDFERDLVRTRRGNVQLVLNAEDGAQAGVTQGYATMILANYAATLSVRLMPAVTSVQSRAAAVVSTRDWFNPTLNYKHFTVPGILVMLVTLVGTLMTALNIVREKEAGTLDQLNVTPISRGVFIAAKLLPLWCIALVELSLGLVIARFVFGVPMHGSLLVIYVGAGIYLAAALGVGLWISSVAETQQQALFVTFAVLMIYTLMSGLYTPVGGMPGWVQWIAQINPLLHFIALMRAVTLKGAGFADVSRQLLALTAIGATTLTLAVLQYRKRAA
jgi:ABC-2 type transport system permease protein